MKFQLPYLVVVMATILFTISIIDDENTIIRFRKPITTTK